MPRETENKENSVDNSWVSRI